MSLIKAQQSFPNSLIGMS